MKGPAQMRTVRQWLLCLVWLLCASFSWAQPPGSFSATLATATLSGKVAERSVTLPHVLNPQDIDPRGSRVRYRLNLWLDRVPEQALGIFINKMSLSGAVYLNDQLVGQCAHGALEQLRCLHRPSLFRPAAGWWREGVNRIEVEIYGTHRQLNGLSPVVIGDADRLYQEAYAPRMAWVVTGGQILAVVVVTLGLFSLAAGLAMRKESIYTWYGLTSLFLAVSFANLLTAQSWISREWLDWLIINGRLSAAHLLLLTSLFLLEKQRPWHSRLTVGYCACVGLLVCFADENRHIVSLAYVPALVIGLMLIVLSVRWTWQSKKIRHALTSLMLIGLFLVGLRDWIMYSGHGRFEYVYLAPYGFAFTVFFVGFLLMCELVGALQRSQQLRSELEREMDGRTTELKSALEIIARMERTALSLTEAIPVGTYVQEISHGVSRYTFLSRRWLEMLDLSRDAVMSDPEAMLDRIHPEDLSSFVTQKKHALAGVQIFLWEGRIVVADRQRWIRIEAVPRMLDSNAVAFEGVVIDITAHKDAEAALKQAYEQLTQAAVLHSKNEEREQLLQDMHDGFGSQLASARLMAEMGLITPGELPVILQECMADLYLIADTLSHTTNTFEDSIADLKVRTQRRTEHLPVRIDWHVEVDGMPDLPQRTTLQALRVVQEALNNALKHARASHITIHAVYDQASARMTLKVVDDGVGMQQSVTHGRGMGNMRQRAYAIGASLDLLPSAVGTAVVLTVAVLPSSAEPVEAASTLPLLQPAPG